MRLYANYILLCLLLVGFSFTGKNKTSLSLHRSQHAGYAMSGNQAGIGTTQDAPHGFAEVISWCDNDDENTRGRSLPVTFRLLASLTDFYHGLFSVVVPQRSPGHYTPHKPADAYQIPLFILFHTLRIPFHLS